MIFFLQIWLSWTLDPDPDPHSEKLLDPDPDPHKMNADPQPCRRNSNSIRITGNGSKNLYRKAGLPEPEPV